MKLPVAVKVMRDKRNRRALQDIVARKASRIG